MSLDFPTKKILLNTLAFLIVTGVTGVSLLDAKPRDKDRWDKKYGTEAYIFGKNPYRPQAECASTPQRQGVGHRDGEGRNGGVSRHAGV